ncbi:hypothetical protein HanOQP8_Chr01g0034031 [Helianthus annuus]|nr:hypothetical protein HanOQP8_Chr01g0034031 [Helianthus annuus]
MESQVTFTHEASSQPDDVFVKDVITSETNCVTSNLPVKKQTRQWAAWTRQEEESFFTALRQVGKASFTMILYVGLQTNRMNTNKTLFMNKSCSSVKKYMCPRTVHEYLPNVILYELVRVRLCLFVNFRQQTQTNVDEHK